MNNAFLLFLPNYWHIWWIINVFQCVRQLWAFSTLKNLQIWQKFVQKMKKSLVQQISPRQFQKPKTLVSGTRNLVTIVTRRVRVISQDILLPRPQNMWKGKPWTMMYQRWTVSFLTMSDCFSETIWKMHLSSIFFCFNRSHKIQCRELLLGGHVKILD